MTRTRQGNKKGKQPASKNQEPKATSEEVKNNRIPVDWAVPRAHRRDIPDQRHIDNWAQALYARRPDELQPEQAPLPDAQMRSPIYQRNGKDIQAGDANQSSTALRNLYNEIKGRSVDEPDGSYGFGTLTESFEAEGENTPVVISRAVDEEILLLDSDRRLQVIIGDQTAHISFFRRAQLDEEDQVNGPYGFFIDLPRGTSVTVNGITYTNNGNSPLEPFVIGPLEDYAVIELLSQPVFFFRKQESLRYKTTTRRVSPEELARRDQNGDVDPKEVTLRWLPYSPKEDANSDGGDRERDVRSQVGQSEEDDEPREEPPMEQEEKIREEPRPEQEEMREEYHSEQVEAGDADHPEQDDYSDEFTDDGESITDPWAYVSNRLKMHINGRLASIFPRVIASINHRQLEHAGFSFVYNDMVFRPGRTLFTALTDCGRHLLFVGEVQPDKSIRLSVLYARKWRSKEHHREKIGNDLRNWLVQSDWWRNFFGSHEQMVARLPAEIEWAPCAQTSSREATFTYTVLNAWALAMGLELNPNFTPHHHGNEAFFIQAEQIFDMALSNSLTWKVLLSFLRCTGFVKPPATGEDENGEDANLPPRDRRFDQRKRFFEVLIADQTHADRAFPRMRLDTERMAVQVDDGISPCSPTHEDRDAFAQHKQLRQRLEQFVDGRGDSSSVRPSLVDSVVENERPDPLAVPEDFNPCEYLKDFVSTDQLFYERANEELPETIERISSETHEDVINVRMLSRQEIQDSIAAVVRAVNLRHLPGAGFTTESSVMEVSSSADKREDSIGLYVWEATNSHELCLLVQNPTGRRTSCTIVDSAPWATKHDDRIAIRNQIRVRFFATGSISWVLGPQQAAVGYSGYHVLLNAWSIILGLPLNSRDFKSKPNIIRDTFFVARAVREGDADWKVIWALLRCYGYVSSTEAPAPGRRFARTITAMEHADYAFEMASKKNQVVKGERINVYDHFEAESDFKYDENDNWDGFYPPEDGKPGVSEPQTADSSSSLPSSVARNSTSGFRELQPSEITIGTPSFIARDGNRGARELQPSEISINVSPSAEIREQRARPTDEVKLCQYVRDTLRMLLADEKVTEELRSFRKIETTTTRIGKWLVDEEVALALSSVFMAINKMQSIEEGFSIVPQSNMEAAISSNTDYEAAFIQALRPGRPLIAPVVYKHHIVLLVAQLNDNGLPTISFLDSMASHYKKKAREEVFQLVWRGLRNSSWWRGLFEDRDDFDQAKPAAAFWVRTASQSTSNDCGYFTILNAWGLALGLELNPDLRLRWTDVFFQELQNVMHLARLGYADWKLIYAFLRCHDIVRDGVVPENRRFARTHDTRIETEFNNELEKLREVEMLHWRDHKYDAEALSLIRNCNHIPNMIGRPHNESSAFPSDTWRRDDRDNVSRLQRFDKFNLNYSKKQVQEENENLMANRLEKCKKLASANLPSGKPSREALVRAIRDEINHHYEGLDSSIEQDPGPWIEDNIGFYNEIIDDEKVQKIFRRSGITKANDWRSRLEANDLNLAIASVLEAIDALQSDLHAKVDPRTPFAGGFALASSLDLQLALDPEFTKDTVRLSRPRRAWLMPFAVTKTSFLPHLKEWANKTNTEWKYPRTSTDNNLHSILVLLQEVANEKENSPEGTEFQIQIFDSNPKIYTEVRLCLQERFEVAARRLGWSTHRSGFSETQFDRTLHVSIVPEEARKLDLSGHHVLINAWIIALGLHPNPHMHFNDEIYEDLSFLYYAATAGILDWKTLVAWFFYHDLTVEREFSSVPENRRFDFTFTQTDERALRERITQYMATDDLLAALDPSIAPYDYTNNFKNLEQEEGDHDRGLTRRVDDTGLSSFDRPRGTKRKRRQDSDDDLDLLDDHEICRGYGKRGVGRCSPVGKRPRMIDHLSFLDVY